MLVNARIESQCREGIELVKYLIFLLFCVVKHSENNTLYFEDLLVFILQLLNSDDRKVLRSTTDVSFEVLLLLCDSTWLRVLVFNNI